MSALDRPSEIMRWTYGLVPIVSGADKFTNLLTDWTQYLSPLATRIVPVKPVPEEAEISIGRISVFRQGR